MTDEQIRQNAEEYASKIYGYPYTEEISCKQHYIDGYIAGAHSRDEEIEKWKNLCDRLSVEKRQLQKKLHNLDN